MVAAKRGGKRIGYIRVSTVDQNTARQLDGVELDKVFTDKASGKDTNRPQLNAALDYLRDGEYSWSTAWTALLATSVICLTPSDLKRAWVVVEFVKESLTFTGDDSAMSKLC